MQRELPDQFVVESLETKTEWESTYYSWVVYIHDLVVAKLTKEEEMEFEENGIVAVLGSKAEAFAESQDFDDAVEKLFYYLFENNLL